MSYALVFVGLGNPGIRYEKNRHNLGFLVIDRFAKSLSIPTFQNKFSSLVAEATLEEKRILLVKPQTFMNNSGQAVGAIFQFYKLRPEQFVVTYDDLDLPVAEIRIRKQGGAGGHNGMISVIEALGTESFARIRIGIERGGEVINHVLSDVSPGEAKLFDQAIERSVEALKMMGCEGLDKAMNVYNKKETDT